MKENIDIKLYDHEDQQIGRIQLPNMEQHNLVKLVNCMIEIAMQDAMGLERYEIISKETHHPQEEGYLDDDK